VNHGVGDGEEVGVKGAEANGAEGEGQVERGRILRDIDNYSEGVDLRRVSIAPFLVTVGVYLRATDRSL
jgi:hypothetical protein